MRKRADTEERSWSGFTHLELTSHFPGCAPSSTREQSASNITSPQKCDIEISRPSFILSAIHAYIVTSLPYHIRLA
ncbi:hypothetical protein TWF730_007923 [Orbilia blumenaviensis]|uniref:Uncharacterized protein n=1 Tax=Orbilia blumenaviensis TaxID=1796055 RepID=A0AAV9V9X1_9PEZI